MNLSKNWLARSRSLPVGHAGWGAEIARALADEGADVAISYGASVQKAQAVTRNIETKGVRTAAFQADQGMPTQADGLIHAAAVVFLATPLASYMTGAVFDAEGGYGA